MSKIREKIESINNNNEKALTIFLTSGYPNKKKFIELVTGVVNAGADIIEIGLPFADSLADGPVIQTSYKKALDNGINLEQTLSYINEIKKRIDVPIILMSSSNPILNFGKEKFCDAAKSSMLDGLIIPDVPLEEYNDFFDINFEAFDTILLTTPTSSEERINEIDIRSTGFIYCVSVVGTTGMRNKYDDYVYKNLNRTYNTVIHNKMQIGFGVSSAENIKQFSPYCDGVIVGSAVINSLANDNEDFLNTLSIVKELKKACRN